MHPEKRNIGHHLRETFKLGDKVCCWPNREFGSPAASLIAAGIQNQRQHRPQIVEFVQFLERASDGDLLFISSTNLRLSDGLKLSQRL